MKKKYYYHHEYESPDILIITAFNHNKVKVGHLNIVIDKVNQIINPWVSSALVYEEYRRQGIATEMYNYAENLLKSKLVPSEEQTEDAVLFWASRKRI